jgi:hypothetical protein
MAIGSIRRPPARGNMMSCNYIRGRLFCSIPASILSFLAAGDMRKWRVHTAARLRLRLPIKRTGRPAAILARHSAILAERREWGV